jgi:hypothetical protein
LESKYEAKAGGAVQYWRANVRPNPTGGERECRAPRRGAASPAGPTHDGRLKHPYAVTDPARSAWPRAALSPPRLVANLSHDDATPLRRRACQLTPPYAAAQAGCAGRIGRPLALSLRHHVVAQAGQEREEGCSICRIQCGRRDAAPAIKLHWELRRHTRNSRGCLDLG